jgi:hypothetical protein
MLMSDEGAKPMKTYYTVLTRMGYSHEGLLEDSAEAERLRVAHDEIYPGCEPHTVIALVPKAEAEAAIEAARTEVSPEIVAIVQVFRIIYPGDPLLDALSAAQRKACGLEEK